MLLNLQELNAVRTANQKVKAVGSGEVRIVWKCGKIERITFENLEQKNDIYGTELKGVDLNPKPGISSR